MNIKNIDFSKEQYYQEVVQKNQIVLHHTVSDPLSAMGDINYWLSNKDRIATYAVLAYDGTINKCFSSTQWAHHLGVKAQSLKDLHFADYATRNTSLNKHSIGIEIDSFGGLIKKGNQYINAYGRPISDKLEVFEVDWRGYHYFQKYSKAQIDSLAELLPLLMEANEITDYGIKDGNLDVRTDALRGEKGIFSHSSYRSDKSDIYPDPELLKMLNGLTNT